MYNLGLRGFTVSVFLRIIRPFNSHLFFIEVGYDFYKMPIKQS